MIFFSPFIVEWARSFLLFPIVLKKSSKWVQPHQSTGSIIVSITKAASLPS